MNYYSTVQVILQENIHVFNKNYTFWIQVLKMQVIRNFMGLTYVYYFDIIILTGAPVMSWLPWLTCAIKQLKRKIKIKILYFPSSQR